MKERDRNELPQSCELSLLGLDPAAITDVALIHKKHGSRLYRVQCEEQSYVLKWFDDPDSAREVRCYGLLEKSGVPTLPVYGRTDDALLLEDLDRSITWRLAAEADMEHSEIGVAVAEWYLALHAAGREFLSEADTVPAFLKRETDILTAAVVLETGVKLGLSDNKVWTLAAEHIEALKAAAASLPQTFTYNDFFWGNLALSRQREPRFRAIVFDYHLLGIGLAYSDCRNVVGSLGERARAAFWETYGEVDPREALLDAPLSALYTLAAAAGMPKFPSWAGGCLEKVQKGVLEKGLRQALEFLQHPPV